MTHAVEAAAPLITLTTDFGSRDSWNGQLRGVIASICPDARVVDLATDLPAHDLRSAAWALYTSVGYFPRRTIHLAVVDPGVGTDRRALIVQAGDGYLVGPDNGILSWAMVRWSSRRYFHANRPEYHLRARGTTFQGRDVFAPVAAYLASGIDPQAIGERIEDPVRLAHTPPSKEEGALHGRVMLIDRFGNLITNIEDRALGVVFGDAPLEVDYREGCVGPLAPTYAALGDGLGAVINGAGHLEICGNQRSAAATLGAVVDEPVIVRRSRS